MYKLDQFKLFIKTHTVLIIYYVGLKLFKLYLFQLMFYYYISTL